MTAKSDIYGIGSLHGVLRAVFSVVLIVACYTGVRADDPAKLINRYCPVVMVKTEEEYQQAVLDGPKWTGGEVRVIGECTYDSLAIKSWAEAQGIKCRIASTVGYVGRRKIARGHWTVIPEGSKYTVDYVQNIGVVTRRIRSDEEYVFHEESDSGRMIAAEEQVVHLAGTQNPVRSINFSKM